MAINASLLNLMGLTVSGDLGPFTIYTDRFGRKVAYPIAPPTKPPTNGQQWQRERFRAIQAAWSALNATDKANLEDACRRLSLCLTGQNLFLSCSLRSDAGTYATVSRQSGLTLPPLPAV